MSQSKYDEVVGAYLRLREAGEEPTQDKIKAIILEKTGVKMSNSTVSKHLRQLRESDPDEFLKGASSDGNEPIPGEHLPLMQMVYHSIRRATELSHSNGRMESLEAEAELLRERLTDYEVCKAELAGFKTVYQQTLSRLEQLTRENERLQKFAGISQETEQLLNQRDEALSRIQKLSQEIKGQREQITDLTVQIQTKDEQLTIAHHRIEADSQELSQIRSEATGLRIQNGLLEGLQQELKQLKELQT